jgi:hypothetical protein
MLRLRVESSALEAISAARWSVRLAPFVSAGTPATRPAMKAPGGRPAWRAAARMTSASSRLMRNDNLTWLSIGTAAVVAVRSKPDESDCPRASTKASRTRSDGETPRARARSNSAAFRPCKSTLMRSRDEGAIPEPTDMRCVSDNGATAPILHSPVLSVSAQIEVAGPMISGQESSSRPCER